MPDALWKHGGSAADCNLFLKRPNELICDQETGEAKISTRIIPEMIIKMTKITMKTLIRDILEDSCPFGFFKSYI